MCWEKKTQKIGLERDTLSWVWLWSESRAIRAIWCPARGHKLSPRSQLDGPVCTQLNEKFRVLLKVSARLKGGHEYILTRGATSGACASLGLHKLIVRRFAGRFAKIDKTQASTAVRNLLFRQHKTKQLSSQLRSSATTGLDQNEDERMAVRCV